MTYRIAVDVGGTFTDVIAVDEAGRTTFVKAPSSPETVVRPSDAVRSVMLSLVWVRPTAALSA